MLLLLGGAARCGKTTLATRIARHAGVGWLSTDTVRDVVDMLMPLYAAGGIGRSHLAEADLFFPYFERTVASCACLAERYLIEGVGFYPRHVQRLDPSLDLRAVFVGQSSVSVDAILENESRNDWHRHLDRDLLQQLPGWIESWSAEIADECNELGYAYVDLSEGFAGGQARAEQVLLGNG